MHTGLLHLHSALRWVILVAGVVAVVRAHRGLVAQQPYARAPGSVFVLSLHTQLLVGLVLYFGTSGLVSTFLAAPGPSMKDAVLRFFGMEHLVLMLAAVVVATIGSARARRAADDAAKNRGARLFFAIALILLVLGIPWPFRAAGAGRAWMPGMTPSTPLPVKELDTSGAAAPEPGPRSTVPVIG
jgi:hypothetical protein